MSDKSDQHEHLRVSLAKPYFSPGEDVRGTIAHTAFDSVATSRITVLVHGHVFAPKALLQRYFAPSFLSQPKGDVDSLFSFSDEVCVFRSQEHHVMVDGRTPSSSEDEPLTTKFEFSCPLPEELLPSFRARKQSASSVSIWYAVSLVARSLDSNSAKHCIHVPFGVNPKVSHSLQKPHPAAALTLAMPPKDVSMSHVRVNKLHPNVFEAGVEAADGIDLGTKAAFEALQNNTVRLRDYAQDDVVETVRQQNGSARGSTSRRRVDSVDSSLRSTYHVRSATGTVATISLVTDMLMPTQDVEIGIDCDRGSSACQRVRVKLVCTHRHRELNADATSSSGSVDRDVTDSWAVHSTIVDLTNGLRRAGVHLHVPTWADKTFRTPFCGVEWALKFEFFCPVPLADGDPINGHEEQPLKTMRWQLPVFVHCTEKRADVNSKASVDDTVDAARWRAVVHGHPASVLVEAGDRHSKPPQRGLSMPLSEHVFVQTITKDVVLD